MMNRSDELALIKELLQLQERKSPFLDEQWQTSDLNRYQSDQVFELEDHFVWIQSMPVAADVTRLRLCTMVPRLENTEEKRGYWKRNHQLTLVTLDEDFDIGEGIQRGLACNANTQLNFGRFEGALAALNASVDKALDPAST